MIRVSGGTSARTSEYQSHPGCHGTSNENRFDIVSIHRGTEGRGF